MTWTRALTIRFGYKGSDSPTTVPMPRYPVYAFSALLTACAAPPHSDNTVTTDAAAVQRAVAPDTTAVALAEFARPGWIPLHRDPRVGDYAIHQRLSPRGLTAVQRRTEIIAVAADHVVVRRTFGDAEGRVLARDTWHTDREGHTQGQHKYEPKRETGISPAETLELASGRFHIDRIVTRTAGPGVTTVSYLDTQVPFSEVVSLKTRKRYGQARMIKLLGQIAVQTEGTHAAARSKRPIDAGWLLMHHGRGKPPTR